MAFDRHRSGPPRISRWNTPAAEAARCRPRDLRVAFSALRNQPERSQRRSASLLASLGIRAAPPPTHRRRVHSRCASRRSKPPATHTLGPTMPPVDSCSALVVSHHRDGFLRVVDRGLVASRCRSWGSPRFPTSRARLHPKVRGTRSPSSRRRHPSKNPPHLQPSRVAAVVAFLPFPARVRPASDDLATAARGPRARRATVPPRSRRGGSPRTGACTSLKVPSMKLRSDRRTGGPPRHRVRAPVPCALRRGDVRWLGTTSLFDLPSASRRGRRGRSLVTSAPERARRVRSRGTGNRLHIPKNARRSGRCARTRRQRTGPQPEVDTSRAGCLRVRTFSGDPKPEGPTSRPCSEGESVTSRRVATVATSYPSMGFHFPFEVSSHRRDVSGGASEDPPTAGASRERARPHRSEPPQSLAGLPLLAPRLAALRVDQPWRVCPTGRWAP
jgi:hypothetical protein